MTTASERGGRSMGGVGNQSHEEENGSEAASGGQWERPTCSVCSKPCPNGHRVNCSRACTIRAADRRRKGKPVHNRDNAPVRAKKPSASRHRLVEVATPDGSRRAAFDPADVSAVFEGDSTLIFLRYGVEVRTSETYEAIMARLK